MSNGVSKTIEKVTFERPIKVFATDSLELSIKHNTAMIVNAAGRVRELVKIKLESKEDSNGTEISTRG